MFTKLLRSLGHTTLGVVALPLPRPPRRAEASRRPNPACVRLEASSPPSTRARSIRPAPNQVKRAEDAVAKQQADLDARWRRRQAGLRGTRVPVAVLEPGAAMRADHSQFSRCAATSIAPPPISNSSERHRQPGQPARALIGQRRRTIAARNTPPPPTRPDRGLLRQVVRRRRWRRGRRPIRNPAATACRPAPFTSACAPATATISRSRTRRCRAARRRRALVPAPVPRGRSRALRLPQSGEGMGGRCRRAAGLIRRCRAPSIYRKEFTAACSCRKPAELGRLLQDADDRRRCKAATSSSPTKPRTLSQAPQQASQGAPLPPRLSRPHGTATPATTPDNNTCADTGFAHSRGRNVRSLREESRADGRGPPFVRGRRSKSAAPLSLLPRP